MKQHTFAPRFSLRAVAAAGMAVLIGGALVGGTATAALAGTAATVPGAPTGLAAAPGSGTATLSWSAPGSDGGSAILDYVVAGGPSPAGSGISETVSGDTATISGLTNGTAYSFSVHAVNAAGDGPAATATVTPQAIGSRSDPGSGSASAPGAPVGVKTDYGDGFIALSWSAPASAGSSPVTGYRVYMATSSSFADATMFSTSAASFRTTDVQNGSTYFIKVTAVSAAGEGPATSVAQVTPVPRAVPPVPTGLTAQARPGEVILSWSPPPGGLKSGDGYLIYRATSPGGEGTKAWYPHLIENTTSFPIEGLQAGTRYYFQIALVDGNSQVSARSAEVSAVPAAAAGTSPSVRASASTGTGAGSGGSGGGPGQPGSPGQGHKGGSEHHALSSPAGILVIVLGSLSVAATGGAIAIALIQRRRRGRGTAAIPAPRYPYDDRPASSPGRVEELNGPRYR